ncbi:testin isoform X1, partial [Tachysurus ichikawai]
ITLGHEIGAGAACLKCKDKCEGFELHFWRKICRNCKCGLEDHDVQLQSEENQKVGRLFEDTKYTSLMAKLKRDGVPSYQGSQLTITISTPAIGAAVPIAVAGTAGTVSPVYSQGVPGHDAPSVPHKGAPTAAGHGAPTVHGQGAPTVHGQGAPTIHGQGAPSVHGQGAPSVHGQGAPS